MTPFIAHSDTTSEYSLQLTITHTLVSTVTSSLLLLDSGFQPRAFPFLRVLELSPASVTGFYSNSSQRLKPKGSLTATEVESESYITTDSQSASLSWNKAPIWGLRPDFYYCQTFAGLLTWDALSDERTVLSFTISAGPRQSSDLRVRVPCDHILLSHIWDFLFVASYDSQGYGGGIPPRLHTEFLSRTAITNWSWL
jgi:hypothetical protein